MRIMLVDDDDTFRKVLAAELADFGYEVVPIATGEDALRQAPKIDPEIVLLDLRLPGMDGIEVLKQLRGQNAGAEVIMLTGHGSIDSAIESIRMGAFDYVVKPCSLDELNIRLQRAVERRSLRARANLLERGLTPPDLGSSFVGNSPRFRALVNLIERVAPSGSTVLITGETGVGKERAAKLIHARSLRRQRPFVVVECAALQESLLQSELFGHERGAFTGADRSKPGLFEVANGGTIFLDEIGEVSPATQTKLLRVLDTATFRRVGGTAEIQVDVRVLAATNRNLTAMVRQGLFREDLYYRLNTICIEIPPLRERADDIELLAGHFAGRFKPPHQLSNETLRVLLRHHWPGNVRELLHVIEAATVVCEGPEIRPEHLPISVRSARAANGDIPPTLDELERKQITIALESTSGHRGKAAKLLGISERNLYRKLRDYNLLP